MKTKQIIRAAALTLALCISLCACGEQAGSAPSLPQETEAAPQPSAAVTIPQTTASPQEQTGYVYAGEYTDLSLEGAQPERLLLLGDTLALEASLDAGGKGLYLPDSGTLLTFPEIAGEILTMAPAGAELWCCARDDTGLSLYAASVPEGAVGQSMALADTAELYPYAMAVGGDGNFYLAAADRLLVFSPQGKKLSDLTLQSMERVISLLALEGGQVLLDAWKTRENGTHLVSVAFLDTESIGASLTDPNIEYRAYSGWEGGALLDDGSGLYALALTDDGAALEAVLDWIDTDINPSRVLSAAAGKRETIYLLLGDENGFQLGTLTRIPANNAQETVRINVGVYSWSSSEASALGDLAVRFNQSQEAFRVHLVSYNRFADGTDRIGQDAEDLDLILTSRQLVEEEKLTDLRTLFDGIVGENTILSCVQSAMTGDNGITGLPLTFQIKTLIGNSDLVGEKEGWSPEEFRDAVEANPEATVLQISNGYDVLGSIITAAGDYISDAAPLLEAVKNIPAEEDALYGMEANTGKSAYTCLLEGSLLINDVYIADYSALQTFRAALGDKLVYKGYPVTAGNGGLLTPGLTQIMIPKASRHTAEAWEFLKTLLTDGTFRSSYQSQGFPILEEAFDAVTEEAMAGLRYTSETGETVSSGGTVWLDGQEYEAAPITQNDVDWLKNYLSSLSGVCGENSEKAEQARTALKQVLEEGADPQEAAKNIS